MDARIRELEETVKALSVTGPGPALDPQAKEAAAPALSLQAQATDAGQPAVISGSSEGQEPMVTEVRLLVSCLVQMKGGMLSFLLLNPNMLQANDCLFAMLQEIATAFLAPPEAPSESPIPESTLPPASPDLAGIAVADLNAQASAEAPPASAVLLTLSAPIQRQPIADAIVPVQPTAPHSEQV